MNWNKSKDYFSKKEIALIMTNAYLIKKNLIKIVKQRNKLLSADQGSKWLYILMISIKKGGGWSRLTNATTALSPHQFASKAFGAAVNSGFVWMITAGVTAI